MLTNKNNLFTIGQFAAIHGVTKKALIWYDEMGLLKPAFIGENGYRYYTYAQSSALETILMLRELDVSLSEIREFMSNRSAQSMELLLNEKIAEVNRSIAKLKNIQQALVSRHQDMTTLLHLDLSKINIVEKKKSYLSVVSIGKENTTSEITEHHIERVIEETKTRNLHSLHDAAYGTMISVDNLYQGHFEAYEAIYIEISHPTSRKGLYVQPAGKYLRAFCKGSWDNLPDKYNEILEYAKRQGLSLYGYSYETGINESVINTMQDYITQIEIPIKDIEHID